MTRSGAKDIFEKHSLMVGMLVRWWGRGLSCQLRKKRFQEKATGPDENILLQPGRGGGGKLAAVGTMRSGGGGVHLYSRESNILFS